MGRGLAMGALEEGGVAKLWMRWCCCRTSCGCGWSASDSVAVGRESIRPPCLFVLFPAFQTPWTLLQTNTQMLRPIKAAKAALTPTTKRAGTGSFRESE
jgi:hypothetical protein